MSEFKKYLVTRSLKVSDKNWKIYQRNDDIYESETGEWSIETIEKYKNYDWIFFDVLEEAEELLREIDWNGGVYIPSFENGDVECSKCGRKYNGQLDTAYYGEEIFGDVEYKQTCFCGHIFIVEGEVSINFKTKEIEK